jgi:hypothetical protein
MVTGLWKDLENVVDQNNKAKCVRIQTFQVIQRTELSKGNEMFGIYGASRDVKTTNYDWCQSVFCRRGTEYIYSVELNVS